QQGLDVPADASHACRTRHPRRMAGPGELDQKAQTVGPAPAAPTIRNAVRETLADLEPGGLILAACSGGADSLALAAALAFVAPRMGLRAGAVTVDHGLQEGSAARAASVAAVR